MGERRARLREHPYWGSYGDDGLPHRFVLWCWLRGVRSDCDLNSLWGVYRRLEGDALLAPAATGDVLD